MVRRYYLASEKHQAVQDWKLSLRQIACIYSTSQNFWVVADEEGNVTVSFESQ